MLHNVGWQAYNNNNNHTNNIYIYILKGRSDYGWGEVIDDIPEDAGWGRIQNHDEREERTDAVAYSYGYVVQYEVADDLHGSDPPRHSGKASYQILNN